MAADQPMTPGPDPTDQARLTDPTDVNESDLIDLIDLID